MNEIDQLIKDAKRALCDFCAGKERMCIPLQETDSDRVIMRALDLMQEQQKELEQLRQIVGAEYVAKVTKLEDSDKFEKAVLFSNKAIVNLDRDCLRQCIEAYGDSPNV